MAEGFFVGTDVTPASPGTPHFAEKFIAPLEDPWQEQYFPFHKHCAEKIFIMLSHVSSPKINLL